MFCFGVFRTEDDVNKCSQLKGDGGSLHAIKFGLQLATVEVCMHSMCDLGVNGKFRILPQFSTSFDLLDIGGDKHESASSLGSACRTQFCTHDLIKENDLNDHPCTLKIIIALHASFCLCITCIMSFITYYKNDLKILTVATMFLVFKSYHQIERYRMIKFAWSICIVSR